MADLIDFRPYRPRGIVADFLRGLSVVGLARKYGRTRAQIERTLRARMT
jgi:hypothetical protein